MWLEILIRNQGKRKNVILPENKLEKYFPEEYSRKDIEKINLSASGEMEE